METTREMLRRHEGIRQKPYRCTEGKLTVGIGHNLEAKGVSMPVIELMFDEDYAEAEAGAKTLVKNWDNLSERRRGVLINMTFQMGLDRMRKWKNTLFFIEQEDWKKAAYNMTISLWAKQTPVRANELIKIMEEG